MFNSQFLFEETRTCAAAVPSDNNSELRIKALVRSFPDQTPGRDLSLTMMVIIQKLGTIRLNALGGFFQRLG